MYNRKCRDDLILFCVRRLSINGLILRRDDKMTQVYQQNLGHCNNCLLFMFLYEKQMTTCLLL